ncbi:hypothetical protein ACFX2I_032150 [Malus domestica]
MEDNYKFSKASHYLDQDSVKQNQFMVPNKSFNSKASPTKLHLQSFNSKASPTKASPIKASPTTKASPTKASPIKASPTKASPTKASPTKASPTTNASPTKASHYLDQDSVKQNQFMVPNKASTSKLHLQSFNTKASPTKL